MSKLFKLDNCLASYPHISEPDTYQFNKSVPVVPKYVCGLIIPSDNATWADMANYLSSETTSLVGAEALNSHMIRIMQEPQRRFYTDGNTKISPDTGDVPKEYKDMIIIRAKNKLRPQLYSSDYAKVTDPDAYHELARRIENGAIVNALLNVYVHLSNRYAAHRVVLGGLQFVSDHSWAVSSGVDCDAFMRQAAGLPDDVSTQEHVPQIPVPKPAEGQGASLGGTPKTQGFVPTFANSPYGASQAQPVYGSHRE